MSNKNKEIRNISFNASIDENSRTIAGIIPYNSLSEYMGYYEKLQPGCFSKTLSEQEDVRLIMEHNDSALLARTKNGSLKLDDREDGLHFEFDAPETTLGNDTLVQVREGLINGCSFGMIVYQDTYTYEDNREVRTIVEARLLEISLVYSIPAYPDTIVYTRSLSSAFKEGQEIDDAGKEAIKSEIEKLQNLLPKEEEKKEEEHKEEEVHEPEISEEEQKQIDELNAQLEELTASIAEYNQKLDELEKE